MLGITKAFLDLVQFGHQVKSSADTARLLKELNATAKSMEANMGQILSAQQEASATRAVPVHRTLKSNCEQASTRAEEAARRGLEAKGAIQSAKRQFDFHLRSAKELALATPVSEMEEQSIEPLQNEIGDYQVISAKGLGKLGRFQAVSDTEMIIVYSMTLENGWVVVLQDGDCIKNTIYDPKSEKSIYEDICGTNETSGKFEMLKLFGKDGSTANYSTGQGEGSSSYPPTRSEAYYFAGDLREEFEAIVGTSTAIDEKKNFVDSYEGEFSAAILETQNISGQEGYLAELSRNGFGIRTIKMNTSFWWHKGEFERGSPTGFGICSDSKRGEHYVQFAGGAEVTRQSV